MARAFFDGIIRRLDVGMSVETAEIFRGLIEAVHFLHSNNWVHMNITAKTVGLIGNPLRPILLDLGEAMHVESPDGLIDPPPMPGTTGTREYIAPERELGPFSNLVDVWAVGIIRYEMARGCHPWMLALNPWRPEEEYENARPLFMQKYRRAMMVLLTSQQSFVANSLPEGAILIETLLERMLHFPFASTVDDRYRQERISIADALSHEVWDELSFNSTQVTERATRRRRL